MWTLQRLVHDLQRLRINPGDLLFVHSSFKSLGAVCGGVATVVRALERAVGPGGLLLMPSFNLVRTSRTASWNLARTPSTVGWITEYFRNLPGTVRSDHYSHSVAARGPGAAFFIADHRSHHGLVSPWDHEPWGRTYGTHSPMHRAYRRRGRLLMLGVDYESSTYCHVVETIIWNRQRRRAPDSPYQYLDRQALGAFWDGLGRMKRGPVGEADCRVFDITDFVDTLVSEVESNSAAYLMRPRSG